MQGKKRVQSRSKAGDKSGGKQEVEEKREKVGERREDFDSPTTLLPLRRRSCCLFSLSLSLSVRERDDGKNNADYVTSGDQTLVVFSHAFA